MHVKQISTKKITTYIFLVHAVQGSENEILQIAPASIKPYRESQLILSGIILLPPIGLDKRETRDFNLPLLMWISIALNEYRAFIIQRVMTVITHTSSDDSTTKLFFQSNLIFVINRKQLMHAPLLQMCLCFIIYLFSRTLQICMRSILHALCIALVW